MGDCRFGGDSRFVGARRLGQTREEWAATGFGRMCPATNSDCYIGNCHVGEESCIYMCLYEDARKGVSYGG